ncbi:MAG TPA: DUF3078 domain-containing protein [Candidatus Cloacimonadota bacterium]|nr:DUF3078 domain-containing protein [Candidatus Cloacimonadota bacterium]
MKHKLVFILLALLVLSLSLNAEPWKYKGDFNLNLTQTAYSNNWYGTELGSITWTAGTTMSAEKQLTPLFYNINTLKLAYGQTNQQKERTETDGSVTSYWAKPEKSTDKIDAESLLKMTMKTFVNPFIGVRLESQFIDKSDPSLTRLINPMKFTESAGVTRNFIEKGNELLTARFGVAFRQNYDRDVLVTAVPEVRDDVTTLDGGLEFVTEYKNVFSPSNITYNTKLQVYQAVFNSKSDELANDYWKATDMNWEHSLGMKLYKAISINLYLQLLYEKEQVNEIQFKETLGLGLSYNLF